MRPSATSGDSNTGDGSGNSGDAANTTVDNSDAGTDGNSAKAVKTGDSTPAAVLITVMALAAVLAGGAIAVRRKNS